MFFTKKLNAAKDVYLHAYIKGKGNFTMSLTIVTLEVSFVSDPEKAKEAQVMPIEFDVAQTIVVVVRLSALFF